MGALEWALVSWTPRSMSRSMLGVRAWGCPPMPSMESLRSSKTMSRTLGCPVSGLEQPAEIKTMSMPRHMQTERGDMQFNGAHMSGTYSRPLRQSTMEEESSPPHGVQMTCRA